MPLATLADLLGDARDGHYAVGSFNAWSIFSAKSLVETARKLRSPVIISVWQTELDFAGEEQLYEVCLSFARDTDVLVAVFIDHAKTLEEIDRAIALGATSVMIDGSHLPLAENIRLTAQAAKRAHEAGISCEGELGILGEEDGSQPDEALYTDVESVKPFVEGTGIDALAVAIGNAHGFYREEPRLDLDRLAQIARRVSTPLVLHGGSGIPDDDVRRAIEIGITKINIGAEGRAAYVKGLRRSLDHPDNENEKFMHKILPPALASHAKLVEEKMKLFSSDGKA